MRFQGGPPPDCPLNLASVAHKRLVVPITRAAETLPLCLQCIQWVRAEYRRRAFFFFVSPYAPYQYTPRVLSSPGIGEPAVGRPILHRDHGSADRRPCSERRLHRAKSTEFVLASRPNRSSAGRPDLGRTAQPSMPASWHARVPDDPMDGGQVDVQ